LYRLRAGVAPASRAGEQRFEQLLLVGIHLIGLQDRKTLGGRRPRHGGNEDEQRKDASHGASPKILKFFLKCDFERGWKPCPGPRAAPKTKCVSRLLARPRLAAPHSLLL
jgi:hypothetical protein